MFDNDDPNVFTWIIQGAVFFQGDVCLGGAFISGTGASFYDLKKPLPSVEKLIG
jgi:hypothetical protein